VAVEEVVGGESFHHSTEMRLRPDRVGVAEEVEASMQRLHLPLRDPQLSQRLFRPPG
jgi:hypothetical protein